MLYKNKILSLPCLILFGFAFIGIVLPSESKADIYDDITQVFIADDTINLEQELVQYEVPLFEAEESLINVSNEIDIIVNEVNNATQELLISEQRLIAYKDNLDNELNDLVTALNELPIDSDEYLEFEINIATLVDIMSSEEDPAIIELEARIIEANIQLATAEDTLLNINENYSESLSALEFLNNQVSELNNAYNEELSLLKSQFNLLTEDQVFELDSNLKNVYKKGNLLALSSSDLSDIIDNDYNKKQINSLVKAYETESKFYEKAQSLLLKAEETKNDKLLLSAARAMDNAEKQKNKFLEKINKEQDKKIKKAEKEITKSLNKESKESKKDSDKKSKTDKKDSNKKSKTDKKDSDKKSKTDKKDSDKKSKKEK
jgi:hypothetical protein